MIKFKYFLFVLLFALFFSFGYFFNYFFNKEKVILPENIDVKKELKKEDVLEEKLNIKTEDKKISNPVTENKIELNISLGRKEEPKSIEKPKAKFGWNGYYFDSYDDFKKSPEYKIFLQEAKAKSDERDARLKLEQQQQKDAAIYLKKYRYQNEVDRSRQEWIEKGKRVMENNK